MDISLVDDLYVVGFLFDGLKIVSVPHVVLIRKARPAWQKGKLNGIGGRVQPGEAPLAAMRRESREEAGCDPTDWDHFATLHSGTMPGALTDKRYRYAVFCYRSFDPVAFKAARSMTDEVITSVPATYHLDSVETVDYLIPLALDRHLMVPIELVRP